MGKNVEDISEDSLRLREVFESIHLLSKELESLRKEVGELKRQHVR